MTLSQMALASLNMSPIESHPPGTIAEWRKSWILFSAHLLD